MVSALRPFGGLLAALALWALAVLVLAALGLGARVGPHPENAALAPPLPQVDLVEMQSRLGPLAQYDEVSARPLLTADRRPAPVAAAAAGDADAPLEATLTSVLIAGNVRLAILERADDPVAHRVHVGEVLAGTAWRLVELQPRVAVFEGPQGRRELPLRVFDGTGAPMPPPVATARPDTGEGAGEVPPPPAVVQAPDDAAAQDPPASSGTEEPPAMTPEQQVEAIRRRIEARRAMRAQEAAGERAAPETDNR